MRSFASAVLLSCLMFGCAGARDSSRVESLLFLPHQREIVLPIRPNAQPAAFIAATCDHGTRGATRCSHVSVRLDTVLTASTATLSERNRIIAIFLGMSDYNCSAFTAQAFGRKAQMNTANTILDGVSNALAAKSQRNSSLGDLLILAGKTTDGVLGHLSQLGSVETTVEIAINDARRKLRERIATRARGQAESYPLLEALTDLTAYDETCSLQLGKELALQAAARASREEAERVLKALSQSALPAPAPPAQQAEGSLPASPLPPPSQ
jgi:hypothetical protein